MNLKGRSFLTLKDFTGEEIEYLISLAKELKDKKKQGILGTSLKGKNIALGTKDELKKLIKKREIITIDILDIDQADIEALHKLPHVYEVSFEDHKLTILCDGGQHNLIRVLDYLQGQGYSFGYVHSALPTLNDVFLEITGKELRD